MRRTEIAFDPLRPLPDGWEWRPLEELVQNPKQEIVDGPFGSNLKASEYVDEGIPIARLQNIDRNEFVHKNIKFISVEKARQLSRHNFRTGDLLITKLGDPLGKACIAPHSIEHGIIVADLVRVRIGHNEVDSRYLMYAINSPFIARQFEKHTKGTTRPRVNLSIVRSLPIPVAPKTQQKRIVAEIEKQFSRLDEAVVSLKRTKANLKRYKAAVLKAAVEGKLTEEWRKQHSDVDPARRLLERILVERRAKWNGKGKYSEPSQPDITGLPTLPTGWTWARLDAIAALKGGITVDKNRKSSTARTIPYLRVANVQRGYLDLTEVKEIKAPEADIRDLRLIPGDILFNEGGDRDKLGRGWVWEGQLSECIHQNHVFRTRLYSADVGPKLVSWWGNSFGQTYFLREGKQTTNLASINITKLSAFPIPIPPAAEQLQIVAEVERRLSVIDELETTVETNLTRAERLRQSILSEAFSGRLVTGATSDRGQPKEELPLAAESPAEYRTSR